MAAPNGYTIGSNGFYYRDDGSGPYWLDTAGVIHTFSDLIPMATAEWSYAAGAGGLVPSTVAVPLKAAVAGKRNYIEAIQIGTDVLTAATELAIRDGAGGAVLWRMKLGTAALALMSVVFARPLRSSVGNLLEVVTLTSTVAGAVFVNAQGFVD